MIMLGYPHLWRLPFGPEFITTSPKPIEATSQPIQVPLCYLKGSTRPSA